MVGKKRDLRRVKKKHTPTLKVPADPVHKVQKKPKTTYIKSGMKRGKNTFSMRHNKVS